MGRGSYMPEKQAEQVAWSQTFATVVGLHVEDYGVPAAMMSDFITLNTTLQAAWTAASNVASRTRAKVSAKDVALANMKAAARNLVSIIQGTPTVTDAMKLNAEIKVRKSVPTPKPAPTAAPFVSVTAVEGRTVKFELRQSRTKRGKPVDVASATVFTATGPTAPTSMAQWQYAMITTLTAAEISFGPSATGDTVYITAFWTNPRGESGPAATPASVNLPAGGALPSAGGESTMTLRAA